MASNVILIEPNDVNINTSNGFVNGIPQYQDMYIFAELTAESRGRTVITNNNASSSKSKSINLMGNNQNEDVNDPNRYKFTTNYYDGSTGSHMQYEGFGISNIKVLTNSSFIPQVNIQFVDIRGNAFFNQENSPYRVLFDFPPPIFELTIKGYYGNAITYKLHMVKYTSEFQAETGNFVIDAQFVAMTFAPLTDILFRYIVNIGMMNDTTGINPNTTVEPTNTYSLILKLNNLYSSITDKVKTDADSVQYDNVLKKIDSISSAITILKEYANNETLKSAGTPYLIVKSTTPQPMVLKNPPTTTNQNGTITNIVQLSKYDDLIKKLSTSGIPTNLNDRLYIVYVAGNLPPAKETVDASKIANFKSTLNAYRDNILLKNISTTISVNVPDAVDFLNNYNAQLDNNIGTTQYIGIDVTDYYFKLYKQDIDLNRQKIELAKTISTKINNMVSQRLGMKPTIYNIFKIILGDVDTFFNTLRKTSESAENYHKIDKNIIAGNNSDVDGDTIYAFPLIINQSTVYGGIKEERVAPIELAKRATFPELELVDAFIDSFQSQKRQSTQYNMRTEQNDDGSFKWIPVSPYDSKLGGVSPSSPYAGIDSGGVNTAEIDRTAQIFNIVLKRFYMLSQGTIPYNFYDITDTEISKDTNVNKEYVKLFANSEAVNLAASLLNSDYCDLVKTKADEFKGKPDAFYKYLSKNAIDTYVDPVTSTKSSINLYNFDERTVQYFPITPSDLSSGLVFVDKNNANFTGVNLYTDEITMRQAASTDSTNPVDKFNSGVDVGFWTNIFKGKPAAFYYDFTQENVLYVKDVKDEDGATTYNDTNLMTRYLASALSMGTENYPQSYDAVIANGNKAFKESSSSDKKNLAISANIAGIWTASSSYVYKYESLYDTLIKSGSTTGAMVFISNFGHSLGPFNRYPSNLNKMIFNIASAIEVPQYLPAYIGGLVYMNENPVEYEKLYNFYTVGAGRAFGAGAVYLFADIHDAALYLSANDKIKFLNEFTKYLDSDYNPLLTSMQNMFKDVKEGISGGTYVNADEAFDVFLNPFTTSTSSAARRYYSDIVLPLIKRKNIINFCQFTFKMQTDTYPFAYTSLGLKNLLGYKTFNDTYFNIFFEKLATEIVDKQKKLKQEEEEQKKMKGDVDIITQTYYSFKNINDKWLPPSSMSQKQDYPFANGKLINSFAFVDRAMNPIGDTIINAEILVQMLDNPNISIYSALSQLLSLNGFEFFPIQNFMSFQNDDWKNSFKINTDTNIKTSQTQFVCMYIGGSSSYPTTAGNGFKDDSIVDISTTDALDFSTKDTPDQIVSGDDDQVTKNPNFPFRQVRAFRVRFGEQNQSMFTGIKIDSKEYPETNESIQILSRLAGDNKAQAPTPKGQNLYNLYENRSYNATITAMGNAMIQPTQYFQIENVPLFNGAYIVLSVEHNISANKMTTSFSGTKILKYPVPRVKSPIAFTGFDGEISSLSASSLISTADILGNYQNTQYNSMYTAKIDKQ